MKKYFFILLILQSLFSCVKEEIDVNKISPEIEASPSLAVPLAYGNVSLNDFFKNEEETDEISIFIDTENLIHLKYSNALDSFYLSDFIENIEDQDTSVTFLSGTFGDVDVNYDFLTKDFNDGLLIEKTKSLYYTLKPGDGETFFVDSGMVKSGILKFEINSSFKADGEYKIEMPTLKSPTGEVLSVIFSSNDQSSFTPKTVDITGYTISLLDDVKNPNKIKIDYGISITRSSLPITDGANLECVVTTQNLAFDEVYGYIGQYAVDIDSETIDLGFNEMFTDGDIYLNKPSFNLLIENSFGIPMKVTLDPDMKAIINGGEDIPFVVYPLYNPKNIAYPLITELGELKHDSILINKETSNIDEIITAMPDQLTFGGKIEINPDNDLTKYNFVRADSYLKALVEIDLPFDFELRDFVFTDTLDMDLEESIPYFDDINQLELDLNLDNGLPLQLKAQVYFYEQKSETDNSIASLPIDSLIKDNSGLLVASANTVDGSVENSINTFQNVSITGDRLQTIKNTKYAIIKIFIDTDQPGVGSVHNPVKILSTQEFSFRIGAKASAQLNLE